MTENSLPVLLVVEGLSLEAGPSGCSAAVLLHVPPAFPNILNGSGYALPPLQRNGTAMYLCLTLNTINRYQGTITPKSFENLLRFGI